MIWILLLTSGLVLGCATLLSPGGTFKRDLVRGMSAVGGALMTTLPLSVKAAVDTRVITHKVFLDIKIANYTEESSGKNRGAQGRTSTRLILAYLHPYFLT